MNPQIILQMEEGISLKGSYSYHNHPAAFTRYSFSSEDVGFFFEYGCAYAKASDDKYEYEMWRTTRTIELSYIEAEKLFDQYYNEVILKLSLEGEIDIDKNGYHLTMAYLSKTLQFGYERRLKDGE